MPSRQGRLDAGYFSQPTSSSGAARRKRATQTVRRRPPSDDEQDSEGSAGMAAIKLSESPDKRRNGGAEDDEEEDDDDGDVLLLSPEKVADGADGLNAPSDVEDQDDHTLSNAAHEAAGSTERPSNAAAGEEAFVATNELDSAAGRPIIPRKRVSLGPTARAQGRPQGRGPMPKAQTRLMETNDREDSVPSSERGARLTPYIELEPWPKSRKAKYAAQRSRSDDQDRRVPVRSHPAPDMEVAAMEDIFEVSDDDDSVIATSPPRRTNVHVKQRHMPVVELPSSQRSQAGPSRARIVNNRSSADPSHAKSKLPASVSKHASSKKRQDARTPSPISGIESDDDIPLVRSVDKKKDKMKGKGRARMHDTSGSSGSGDDDDARDPRDTKKGKQKVKSSVKASKKPAKKRRVSLSSGEREDMMSDIKLDEPKRFKSQSRLRKKQETDFQRKLRKLKEKRLGIIGSDTDSQDEDTEDEDDDTSDSAPDSIEENFIEEDGGVVADGVLPHEFSLNSAQTPEFKFKVVFHYFVLLVVEGTDILPLKGSMKEYWIPQLEDFRRKIEDFRDQRVRSQIWPHSLVNALKAYPDILIASLDYPEEHCVACNRSNYKSKFRVELHGDTYDRNTYESKKKKRQRIRAERAERKAKNGKKQKGREASSSSSESESDSGSDSELEKEKQPEYYLGSHCKKRVHVYHYMSHWERSLYRRVKGWYHDLLRANNQEVSEESESETDEDSDALEQIGRRQRREAKRDEMKRRVKRLRGQGDVPKDYGDVDTVTAWMDKQGHVLSELKWMEDLQEQARKLEFDKQRDE